MRLLRLPGVFKPPSDAWLLAAHMLREPLPAGARVLDLCTGSGILAVLAARGTGWEVFAIDVSRRAVATTLINARLNSVRVHALRGDLFGPINGRRFNLIVSNPPYLPSPAPDLPRHGRARAWEAGETGRAFLDRICMQAHDHLVPGGTLLLVHSSVCGERETLEQLTAGGLQTHVVARQRGPLGQILHKRANWLRDRGLIGADGLEDMLVIRAQRPAAA